MEMTKVVKPMGGDGANEWMKRICPRLLHLRKALEKQHLFRVSGALRSMCILRIGRMGSACVYLWC